MQFKIEDRLEDIAKLLITIEQKLELIQQSIYLSIHLNGKLHGISLNVPLDELEKIINQKD